MRAHLAIVVVLVVAGCSPAPQRVAPSAATAQPKDAAHAGITTPHGDHSPHHGGLVMMNGETHYEVVIDKAGKHQVWFSDAVREELPASIASKVTMAVTRPGAAAELLTLQIDENGEAWIASGLPLTGSDILVKLNIVARGDSYEVEIPYVPQP